MNITLKRIIGEFLSSTDESQHRFLRLWNIGKLGLETEFNLDITGTFKTVILNVNANKTVDLPCDYIHYSKIGEINGKGEVVTYKRNEQLTTLINSGTENRLRGVTTVGSRTDYGLYPYDMLYFNNYYYNGLTYNLYGANSGTPDRGEYKVDEGNRVIFLNMDSYTPNIVLEYLSDGYDEECDDFSVDVRATQCLLAYLRWKNALDMPKKYGYAQVNEYKKEYFREKRLCKMRMNPFVLNEMEHAGRVSTKLVPKS